MIALTAAEIMEEFEFVGRVTIPLSEDTMTFPAESGLLSPGRGERGEKVAVSPAIMSVRVSELGAEGVVEGGG